MRLIFFFRPEVLLLLPPEVFFPGFQGVAFGDFFSVTHPPPWLYPANDAFFSGVPWGPDEFDRPPPLGEVAVARGYAPFFFYLCWGGIYPVYCFFPGRTSLAC